MTTVNRYCCHGPVSEAMDFQDAMCGRYNAQNSITHGFILSLMAGGVVLLPSVPKERSTFARIQPRQQTDPVISSDSYMSAM